MLNVCGSDVVVAKTPGEAAYVLESVSAEKPTAFILIDVMLTGLDGPRIVALLRKRPEAAGARVVLLSAMSTKTIEEMRAAWGADLCLPTHRGLLYAEATMQSWLGLSSNPPPQRSDPPTTSSTSLPPEEDDVEIEINVDDD